MLPGLAKAKNSLFSYYKQLKVTLLNLSYFLAQSKCYKKMNVINTIVLFKDLLDLSVVFMQNAFEIGLRRHHSLIIHAQKWHETFCQALVQPADQIANKYNASAVQADRGQPLSSRLSIHCCSRFCSAIFPD